MQYIGYVAIYAIKKINKCKKNESVRFDLFPPDLCTFDLRNVACEFAYVSFNDSEVNLVEVIKDNRGTVIVLETASDENKLINLSLFE